MALGSGAVTLGVGLALDMGTGTADWVSLATGFLGPACGWQRDARDGSYGDRSEAAAVGVSQRNGIAALYPPGAGDGGDQQYVKCE